MPRLIDIEYVSNQEVGLPTLQHRYSVRSTHEIPDPFRRIEQRYTNGNIITVYRGGDGDIYELEGENQNKEEETMLIDGRIEKLKFKIENFTVSVVKYRDSFEEYVNSINHTITIRAPMCPGIEESTVQITPADILYKTKNDQYFNWLESWVKDKYPIEFDSTYKELLVKLDELETERASKESSLKQPERSPRWRSNVLPKESDANENGEVYYWNGLKKCIQLCKWSDVEKDEPWMLTSELPNPR